MNIAYFAFDQIIPSRHAGFVHVTEFLHALKRMGNHVELYAIPQIRDFVKIWKWSDTWNEYPFNYSRFVTSFKRKYLPLHIFNNPTYRILSRKLAEQKPDLIDERFHLPNPLGRRLAVKLGVPHILEVNFLYIEEGVYQGKFRDIALTDRKEQFNQCQAIITQTKTLKRNLGKITDKPIFVVPNGVNLDRFKIDVSGKRERLGLGDDIVITCVGSFRSWHGFHLIPGMARNFTNAKFLLIGSGELYKEVYKNRTENMIFLGSVPYEDVPKYLLMSDILIAPFDISNFPYLQKSGFWWCPVKLFEYLAAGKPIVSFNFEEVRSIVGEAALLAEPRNLNEFNEYLETLIKDESLREKLGRKGEKIAKQCSWQKRAEQAIEVYRKVLAS